MAQHSPWIAIVDDDPSVLRALARLLRIRGINATTFASAQDFLAVLSRDNSNFPECLILDLQMPEMGGLELQRHLNRASIDIPTIMITAHDEDEARLSCISEGAVAYFL